MSQAFYRKWRPQTWDDVVGQEHVIITLKNAVAASRVGHAYLFAGPRGTGKTSTARLLAKAVNCTDEELANRPCNSCENCKAVNEGRFLDLIEIDAASNTSVDDVRDLRDKINFTPNKGRFKVYIIDEVHMLSTAAFNALLKTLEEPPGHAIFILATTEIHKIPATVLSRCQRHEFRMIPVADIIDSLKKLAASEGLKVEDDVFSLVARQATGSLRDAISLLDQLASTGEEIRLGMAQLVLGTAENQTVIELVDAIVEEDPGKGLDLIHLALDAGSDPRQFARQVVEYLRNLMIVRMGNAGQVETTSEVRLKMAAHAQALGKQKLLSAIRLFNKAANDARSGWQPALPLELALIDSIEFEGEPPQKTEPRKDKSPKAKKLPEEEKKPEPAKEAKATAETVKTEQVKHDPIPDDLSENWKKIISAVRKQSPMTQALLNSCKLQGIKGGALVLAFQSDFVRTKMEQEEHLKLTCDIISDILGKEMQIMCITAASERSNLPSNVDQDGLVADALRMGGEIVSNG